MKTKNGHFRITEEEYAALELRAGKLGLKSTSTLITNVLRFFAQVEQISSFWDELGLRARKEGMTPAKYLVEVSKRDLPKKDVYGLTGVTYEDIAEY